MTDVAYEVSSGWSRAADYAGDLAQTNYCAFPVLMGVSPPMTTAFGFNFQMGKLDTDTLKPGLTSLGVQVNHG